MPCYTHKMVIVSDHRLCDVTSPYLLASLFSFFGKYVAKQIALKVRDINSVGLKKFND